MRHRGEEVSESLCSRILSRHRFLMNVFNVSNIFDEVSSVNVNFIRTGDGV